MGRRTRTERAECPNLRDHTPAPNGYTAWAEWAQNMQLTHRQTRCSGCRRLVIWVPQEQPAAGSGG